MTGLCEPWLLNSPAYTSRSCIERPSQLIWAWLPGFHEWDDQRNKKTRRNDHSDGSEGDSVGQGRDACWSLSACFEPDELLPRYQRSIKVAFLTLTLS